MKTRLQRIGSFALLSGILPVLFLLLSLNANAQCTGGCTGFRTQTQTDWGATCNGGSSSLMTTNFKGAFPSGITIGCGSNKLVLSTAQAVIDFLPSTGTVALLPSGTKTNPGSSYSNMFAGQLVAATINVGMDSYISSFSSNTIHTGDLIIASGEFNGWTVSHLISEANSVIGGCDKSYAASDLSNALNSFNANYENGTCDNHFVTCPPTCTIALSGTQQNVTCNGSSTGSITLTVTGANGTVKYLWNDGSTSQNRTSLISGTYSVTATDAVGCAISKSFTITQPSAISISGVTVNNTKVNGVTGTITLTVSGGTSPYKYLWSDGNTSQNRSGLASGNYSVSVTDANGCKSSASFSISQPSCNINLSSNSTNVTCYGSNNGTINLSIGGCNGSASYLWNDGNTSQNRTGLAPGTYSVTVTDAAGCKATGSYSITQPGTLSASGTQVNVSMVNGSNGSITLSVSGGTQAYSFKWNDGSTSQNRSGLSAGTYSVVVTDAHGCSANASFTITQPICAIAVNGTPVNVSCNNANNASINLNLSGNQGAVSYLWNDGNTSQNRNGLSPISYSVVATDAVGCKANASFSISQPSLLTASGTQVNVSMVNGSDGSITLSVSGGTTAYSFKWNDGSTSQNRTGLSAGTYSVVVTDAHGCSANASFTITQPICAVAVNGTPVNVSCNNSSDASITLNVTGNQGTATYLWNDGNTNANRSGLAPGAYSVTVTDGVGCTATTSVSVTQPDALSTSGTQVNVSMVNGSDGSITLSVSGGTTAYSFKWNDGSTSQNRTGLSAGTYSVIVTDAHGCSANASFTITQPICAVAVNGTPVNVSCNNSSDASITLNVTGNQGTATYLWNDGNTNANRSGLAPGAYSVTVTDGVGCTATTSVSVTQPDALSTSSTQVNVSMVNGSDGSITLSVSGGTTAYSFKWNDGSTSQNRTGLSAGTYSVVVTDAHGCSANASFTITQPICAVAVNGTPVNVSCNNSSDASITLNVTGNQGTATYLWNDGNTNANRSGLAPGAYSVTVTDGVGCTATTSVSVTQPDALSTSGTQVNVSMVNGSDGSITLSVSGGTTAYSFKWNDGSTSQNRTGLSAGTYSVIVTDAHGCSANASFTITQPICAVAVNGTPVNVSCNNSSDASITLNVTGNQGTATYLWNDGNTNANRSGLAPGAYSVTVTDGVGCTATTSVSVTQPDALSTSSTQVNASTSTSTDGSINVTVSGGTTPYAYLWNTGAVTANLSNIAAGTYSVSITDAHGCTANLSVNLLAFCKVKLNVTQPNCFGGNDGSATVTPSGGTGPYTFLWNTGETTQTISAGSGTYSVTVTDQSGGCAANSGTIGIKQPKALKTTVATINTNAKNCNGQAVVTVTGGTTPYTYSWDDGSTLANRTGLCKGTYNLTVTDANGCSTVNAVKITVVSSTASFTAAAPASDFSMSAFPNPSNGIIQLTINSGSDGIATAYLYDLTGRLVLTQKINVLAGMAYQTIDLSHYPNGIYQLRTVDGKNEGSFKIILTK